jgi:hypothetical protein
MMNSALSTAQPTRNQVLHDVRAVIDVADVDLTAVRSDPAEYWAVLAISPQPHSGSATLRDAVIDGGTGRVVGLAEPDASWFEPVLIREGEWRVVTALSSGTPVSSGSYSWAEPQRLLTRDRLRADIYDPFSLPATVLCRLEPVPAPISFHEVSVLPVGWANAVAEAVSGAIAARARAQPSSVAAHQQLRSWLSSPYPLLFSVATAALIRDHILDGDMFDELLDQLSGYRRAVFHYVTVSVGQYLGHDRLTESLTRAWANPNESDHRRAAVLGLIAAWQVAPQAAEIFMTRARAAIYDDEDDYVRGAAELFPPLYEQK